jgi:hypothetical protein
VAFAPRQGRGTASIASLFHMPTPSLADLEMTAGGNANAPQRTTRCKVNDAAKKERALRSAAGGPCAQVQVFTRTRRVESISHEGGGEMCRCDIQKVGYWVRYIHTELNDMTSDARERSCK